ncbi:M56 family metallopeptidase [Christensenella tenuis]|uniref:VanW family protein n=1 Tax=Christensenella tenuis TaxID=2763033 RepID=A0ABR7EHZ2_9FIRM|nr:M56 family metallopeptidase [Christensenella tenuis]MBC5649397.1 VanW family protein [Christensenella tenuis]
MSILRTLFEITVYSAILFALILLLKRIFRNRFSPSLQYFVWFLLIARLAIPFTFESGIGFFTISPGVSSAVSVSAEETAAAPAGTGMQALGSVAQPPQAAAGAQSETMSAASPAPETEYPGKSETPVSTAVPKAQPPAPYIDPAAVLIAIWLSGIAAAAWKTTRDYISLSRRLKRSAVLPPPEVRRMVDRVRRELGVRRDIRVLMQGSISSPALTASFIPKLLLPVSLLGHPAQLCFAIRHELVHFRRYDYLVCLLMLVLRAVYWFNPVVWLMQHPIKTDMEASCDNIATAALPEEEKKAYARTILEMFSSRMCPQPVLGMSLQSNKKTAEKRIRGIFMKNSTKKGIKFISAFAAALLVTVCFTTACQPALEVYPGITDRDKFAAGTAVGGINMGGMTFEEGKEALMPMVEDLLGKQIEYTVKNIDTPYVHSLSQLGVTFDAEAALAHAMEKGGDGRNFPLELQVDDARIEAVVAEDSAGWNQPGISYSVAKEADVEALTTSGQIVQNELETFFRVDEDALAAQIKKQIENRDFHSFAAPGKTELPSPEPGRGLVLMGSATTAISSGSSEGRKYNIWKISDILNGVVIHPGETLSVNDTVGDRTVENGWALAPGIENGAYTDQAGGGICQVSSTMYNAALKAEMTIKARVPHTIMANYVPAGMDATVSTGGPDFAVSNPYDSDVMLIVNCSIPDSQVTVEIWGPVDRDYYLKFESVLEGETPPPEYGATKLVSNPALGEYEIQKISVEQGGGQYTVYAQKYDKDSDEAIGERYQVATSIYSARAATVEIGPGIPLTHASLIANSAETFEDFLKKIRDRYPLQ